MHKTCTSCGVEAPDIMAEMDVEGDCPHGEGGYHDWVTEAVECENCGAVSADGEVDYSACPDDYDHNPGHSWVPVEEA